MAIDLIVNHVQNKVYVQSFLTLVKLYFLPFLDLKFWNFSLKLTQRGFKLREKLANNSSGQPLPQTLKVNIFGLLWQNLLFNFKAKAYK